MLSFVLSYFLIAITACVSFVRVTPQMPAAKRRSSSADGTLAPPPKSRAVATAAASNQIQESLKPNNAGILKDVLDAVAVIMGCEAFDGVAGDLPPMGAAQD